MKLVLLLTFLLSSCILRGQDSTIQKSKFEVFTSNTGRMIKTEIFEGGSQKDYRVNVIKATDLESNASALALEIFEPKYNLLVGTYRSSVLYIDWDEVPGFLKALKLQLPLLDTKPSNDVVYRYATSNGVITTCSFNTIKIGPSSGWHMSFSRVYKYIRMEVDNSAVIIKKKEL